MGGKREAETHPGGREGNSGVSNSLVGRLRLGHEVLTDCLKITEDPVFSRTKTSYQQSYKNLPIRRKQSFSCSGRTCSMYADLRGGVGPDDRLRPQDQLVKYSHSNCESVCSSTGLWRGSKNTVIS